MTTVLDDILVPKAKDLIDRFGKVATFKVQSSETYDTATGITGETETEVSVKVTPPSPYNDRLVDNDLIRAGDMQIAFAPTALDETTGVAISFTPENGMKVVLDSATWKVERVNSVYSGDSIALYVLTLRK